MVLHEFRNHTSLYDSLILIAIISIITFLKCAFSRSQPFTWSEDGRRMQYFYRKEDVLYDAQSN